MKIVCICEDDTIYNLIRAGLTPEHQVPLVIMPEFGGKRKKKRKLSVGQLPGKLFFHAFFKLVQRRPRKGKIDQLIHRDDVAVSTDHHSLEPTKEVRMPAQKINSKATAQLIADCEPDLMFVCGAPILKESIFSIPKHGSINFHFGYSPKYRGHHCLLWPFIHGDYENLAGTFLKIDKGIDTGKPLACVYPHIAGSDSIEAIEIEVAKMARDHIAPLMSSIPSIKEIDGPEPDKVFNINFTSYTPLVHVKYFFRVFANRLFRNKTVLRKRDFVSRTWPQDTFSQAQSKSFDRKSLTVE